MDYASIIKERVPTPELFAHYGFERNRAGVVRCMFHQDKHASMKVYDGARGYHCFSCKATGDVIDFVREYFGLPFRGAVSKINEDFHLGLPINEPVDAEKRRQLRREAELRRAKREADRKERERLLSARDTAFSEWVRLDKNRREYAPKSPSEPFHDLFVEAITKIDYAEYWLEEAEIALDVYERK